MAASENIPLATEDMSHKISTDLKLFMDNITGGTTRTHRIGNRIFVKTIEISFILRPADNTHVSDFRIVHMNSTNSKLFN